MPFTGTFYTTQELIKILGCSKQRAGQIAIEQGWASPVRGIYNAQDVVEYLWARWRMQLAREMGVAVNGLVSHDEWDKDDNCPICGSFAIFRPATLEDWENGADVYGEDWPWLCIKGHDKNSR